MTATSKKTLRFILSFLFSAFAVHGLVASSLGQNVPSDPDEALQYWIRAWVSASSPEREKEIEAAVKKLGKQAALSMASWIKSSNPALEDYPSNRAVDRFFTFLGLAAAPAVPILINALRESSRKLPNDKEKFGFIIGQLGHIGPAASEAIDDILLAMDRADVAFALSESATTLYALAIDKNQESVKRITAFLGHPRLLVRTTAAVALAMTLPATEEVSAVIVEALEQKNPTITAHVLAWLPQFQGDRTKYLPQLMPLFSSDDKFVRLRAVQVVAYMRRDALPSIDDALNSDNPTVRAMGARAFYGVYYHLKETKASDWDYIEPRIGKLLQDDEPEVQFYSLALLGQFRDRIDKSSALRKRVEELSQLGNDKVKKAAHDLLKRIGTKVE